MPQGTDSMTAPHIPHSHFPSHSSDSSGSPVVMPKQSLPGTSEPLPDQPLGRYKEALRMWLHWNEAYDQLTARMFQVAHDQRQMEDLADHVDRLRAQAVAATRQLLD